MFQYLSDSTSATLLDFQRADIFSFGVTLWEIIHRQIPWRGEDETNRIPAEVETQVTNGNRPPITFGTKNDNPLPPQVAIILQFIKECWTQNPTERPTAQVVAKQLNTLLQEETQIQVLQALKI